MQFLRKRGAHAYKSLMPFLCIFLTVYWQVCVWGVRATGKFEDIGNSWRYLATPSQTLSSFFLQHTSFLSLSLLIDLVANPSNNIPILQKSIWIPMIQNDKLQCSNICEWSKTLGEKVPFQHWSCAKLSADFPQVWQMSQGLTHSWTLSSLSLSVQSQLSLASPLWSFIVMDWFVHTTQKKWNVQKYISVCLYMSCL